MNKDELDSTLQKIEENLKFLIKDRYQYIMILSKDTEEGAMGTVMPNIYNPESLTMILESFFNKMKSESPSNKAMKLNGLAMSVLMRSVYDFMNENVNFIDKQKYQQFKSGNIKGLTDDEINRFISIASEESKINECKNRLQRKFNNLFDTAVKDSHIGNELSYHLYQDCLNIFDKFMMNQLNLSQSDMNFICTKALTKIYGKRKSISTFSYNWSTSIFNNKSELLKLMTINEVKN